MDILVLPCIFSFVLQTTADYGQGGRISELNSVSAELLRLGFGQDTQQEWDLVWRLTRTVPDKLSKVPDSQLFVQWPWRVSISPNETVTTDIAIGPPKVSWPADPNSLYTLILEDNDVFNPATGPAKYWHWLVVNIPGCDVSAGEEALEYVPPFSFDFQPDTGLNREKGSGAHRMLMLAYKQKGPIEAPQQEGCNSDVGLFRILDHDQFAEEKQLEGPVAGNFFQTGYAGKTTDNILCYLTSCQNMFFPAKIEGVNTGDQCGDVEEEEMEEGGGQEKGTGQYERVLL